MNDHHRFDRSLIMQRAWKDYRYWKRVGEPRTFSECLRGAWQVARLARDSGSQKYQRAA